MPEMNYKAECLKEIHWGGKTYSQNAPIIIKKGDVDILREAGVIGNIRRVEIETATRSAPENAAKKYKKRETKKIKRQKK